MRSFYRLTIICAFFLMAGCEEPPAPSCNYLHTAGVIDGVAGPDSARVNEPLELTLDVLAPDLCVSEVAVTASFYSDSLYYLDADVKYSTDNDAECKCKVSDHHYVRVYFTAPVEGTIVLSAPPGIGPSASHTVKVY